MSLYLKYRPQTFDDVVGQRHIIDILKKQVELGETMHNYLFFGPRGTGKTTTARILAKAVNCLNLQNGNPCNQCANCEAINKGQTIDFVEIDAASHTQVDNIREEIIEKAPYPPTQLKKKVYIIDEVHMLSKAAFNALLKIMEEPPEYLMFILATTEINRVPDTIVSRCQVFNFKKLTADEIVERLKYIAEKENIKYTESALYMIADVSDGALRDAVKYLEQVSVLGEINEENVVKFLGVASERKITKFLEYLKNYFESFDEFKLKQVFDFLTDLELGGIDLAVFAKQVLVYIDKHFLENIDFYSKVADLFKIILLNLKFYPNSLLAYKVEIVKEKKSDITRFDEIKSISEEKTKEKVEKDDKDKEKKDLPTEKIEENKKVDEKSEINKKEEKTSKKENNVKSEPEETNLEKLMLDAIAKCNKFAIRAILKRYASLESFENNILSMIVINKMQYKILTTEENVKYLEELFSNILNKPITLHIEYMDKEEYLKRKLNS